MKREVVTGFPQRSEICPSFTRLTLGPSGSVCLEHARTVLGLNPMVVWMGMIPWGGAGELGDSKNPPRFPVLSLPSTCRSRCGLSVVLLPWFSLPPRTLILRNHKPSQTLSYTSYFGHGVVVAIEK